MSTPAWHPDPSPASVPGQLRWWDGERWTDHTWSQAAPQFAPRFGGPPADPARDLARERQAGRNARIAALAGAALLVAYLVTLAVMVGPIATAFRDYVDMVSDLTTGETPPPFLGTRWLSVVQGVSWLFSLLFLGVQVLFAIWLYRATEVAQRAGLRLPRTPGWAVAGLFIPIVSLWFPYQSVKALFPPGARRPRVGLWWTLHLTTWLPVIPVGVVAYFSTPAGILLALVGGALPVGEALFARSIISAADRAHADLLKVP